MGAAVAIRRLDLTSGELRKAARKEKNGTVARRSGVRRAERHEYLRLRP